MRIGKREHAATALAGNTHGPDWRELGSSGRTAVLHVPTNVVYKTEYSGDDSGMDNAHELFNYQIIRRLVPDGWVTSFLYVPLVSGFWFADTDGYGYPQRRLVLAFEYVPGESMEHGQDHDDERIECGRIDLYELLGLSDMHARNYLCADGYVVPIDIGSWLMMIPESYKKWEPKGWHDADRRCLPSETREAYYDLVNY